MPLLRSVLAWTTPHRAGRTGGEGSLEVCTGVCTRRVSVACLSQTSRLVEPNAGYFVTQKGAYGIRTRAAAVRGRCPRPLDECAGRRVSVAAAWARRPHARTVVQARREGRERRRHERAAARARPLGGSARRRPERRIPARGSARRGRRRRRCDVGAGRRSAGGRLAGRAARPAAAVVVDLRRNGDAARAAVAMAAGRGRADASPGYGACGTRTW